MGFIIPQVVTALDIGVKPSQISLEILINEEVSQEVLVINSSNEPALYHVYPDDMSDQIVPKPASFRLEPNGSQIVKVEFNIKKPGNYILNLSIVSNSLQANGLVTAPGVKLPIDIKVSGFYISKSWLLFVVISLRLTILFIVRFLKREK